jgi:hypothetical protein
LDTVHPSKNNHDVRVINLHFEQLLHQSHLRKQYSEDAIDAAIAQNADLLLVHHGYFWKGEPYPITGTAQTIRFTSVEPSICRPFGA